MRRTTRCTRTRASRRRTQRPTPTPTSTPARPAERGDPAAVEEADTRGVLLEVAYDGTAFHGWAAQASVRTVEETLRGAGMAMDPRASAVRGASRTDAGVHAEGQLVA